MVITLWGEQAKSIVMGNIRDGSVSLKEAAIVPEME